MKRIANILLALFAAAPVAMAQVDDAPAGEGQDTDVYVVDNDSVFTCEVKDDSRPRLAREILADEERENESTLLIDLPIGRSMRSQLDMAPSYAYTSPWNHGAGPGYWRLHEGFNAEVGFSVTGAFGKGSPSGAGFGEHIAAAYAMPFGRDKRWIGALGVTADRLDWGGYNRTEAGVSGMLGYHVNDWLDLYVYGSYNFIAGQDGGPNPYAYTCGPWGYSPWGYGGYGCWGYGGYGYGPYGYGCGPYGYDPNANLRGRVGAAADFKLGEKGHLTIAFEYRDYDNRGAGWPNGGLPAPPKFNAPYGANDGYNSAGRGYNSRSNR